SPALPAAQAARGGGDRHRRSPTLPAGIDRGDFPSASSGDHSRSGARCGAGWLRAGVTLMAARMEDETLKLGLLMEAAQAQQTLAATTLDRLREHAAGLDAIVREEIRATLLEETQSLCEESRRAAQALRNLQRTANLRVIAWGAAVLSLASLLPCAI